MIGNTRFHVHYGGQTMNNIFIYWYTLCPQYVHLLLTTQRTAVDTPTSAPERNDAIMQ